MATMMRHSEQRSDVVGRPRWATVRLETEGCVYTGRMYVADGTLRVSDVLADDRQFLSLTEVKVNEADQVEAFMAVNKSYIRTLKILDEGATEGRPRRQGVGSPS